jgi:hypothetical protein
MTSMLGFFKRNDKCELAKLPYVTSFSRSCRAILMRLDHVEEHIKV